MLRAVGDDAFEAEGLERAPFGRHLRGDNLSHAGNYDFVRFAFHTQMLALISGAVNSSTRLKPNSPFGLRMGGMD